MMNMVDGRAIAEKILFGLKTDLDEIKLTGACPRLVVFMVGHNMASANYVAAKKKKAERIGLGVQVIKYPESISQNELVEHIRKADEDSATDGIIIQLPLPKHLDKEMLINTISAEKDIDCLTEANKQKLIDGVGIKFIPPAAAAVLEILDYYKVDLSKKNILLVGTGDLIGKPLAAILLRQGINFEIANRYTDDLASLASGADVIISGVGRPGLISASMVKPGAIVIDAGTAGTDSGAVKGDVEFDEVSKKASLITPVPGGVGPVTIAMLFHNLLLATKSKLV